MERDGRKEGGFPGCPTAPSSTRAAGEGREVGGALHDEESSSRPLVFCWW